MFMKFMLVQIAQGIILKMHRSQSILPIIEQTLHNLNDILQTLIINGPFMDKYGDVVSTHGKDLFKLVYIKMTWHEFFLKFL